MTQGKANDGKTEDDFAAQARESIDHLIADVLYAYQNGDDEAVKEAESRFTTELLALHEAALQQAEKDARMDEIELLIKENFDVNADYMKWSKAVTVYMRARLAMLASQCGREKA